MDDGSLSTEYLLILDFILFFQNLLPYSISWKTLGKEIMSPVCNVGS
jgi:hypothetical protein